MAAGPVGRVVGGVAVVGGHGVPEGAAPLGYAAVQVSIAGRGSGGRLAGAAYD
jgi:hypothetical protein